MQTESHFVLDSQKGSVLRPHARSGSSEADSEVTVTEVPLRLKEFFARGRGAAGPQSEAALPSQPSMLRISSFLASSSCLQPITAAQPFAGKQQLLDHLWSPPIVRTIGCSAKHFLAFCSVRRIFVLVQMPFSAGGLLAKIYQRLPSCPGLMTFEER